MSQSNMNTLFRKAMNGQGEGDLVMVSTAIGEAMMKARAYVDNDDEYDVSQDVDDHVGSIILGLMHHCRRHGLSFDASLQWAQREFHEDIGCAQLYWWRERIPCLRLHDCAAGRVKIAAPRANGAWELRHVKPSSLRKMTKPIPPEFARLGITEALDGMSWS